MAKPTLSAIYADGAAYEKFMGRWSRLNGRDFVAWLGLPGGLRWLDVGCGTGALSEVILETCAPVALAGIDPSEAQIGLARSHIGDVRARFDVGDGRNLAFDDGPFDVAVAALVLNFIADRDTAVAEMRRVVRPAGTVAAYVWDFANRREIAQHFWKVAEAMDPEAAARAAATTYSASTTPQALSRLFAGAGLDGVETRAIDITVSFDDFDDYWSSNTGFASPVGNHAGALSPDDRTRLIDGLKAVLPIADDGRIGYEARAWAVRGVVPSA